VFNIKDLVKPVIRCLRAYEAKEIPCTVKLDANESPYDMEQPFMSALETLKTNRYPDPEAKELRKIVAKWFGAAPSQVLHGNGSDELIYYLVTTFGGPVLYPVPTFSMYGIISQALGEKIIAIPLDAAFDIDLGKMIAEIRRERPKLIFLSTPNNPTGNCFSPEKIIRLLGASKGIVIVDEAYQQFSGKKGFIPLLKEHKNLVVMRSLSKIGLAALRLGFLIADPDIIAEVNKVRLPFNVNAFSQAFAVNILRNGRGIKASVRVIISERRRLFREMENIDGVHPYPSEANFILFRVKDPGRLYDALLRRGVLIRDVSSVVEGCLRVTIGTPEENTLLLEALKASLP
jgi:histidinol-phosphate aminotransferase